MTASINYILESKGLEKSLIHSKAIASLDLSINQFKKTAIIGETGSGKTTLLKMLAGLEQPDEGAVFYKGNKIKGPDECLIPGHSEIAYLSQHFELRNNYYVQEVLSFINEFTIEESSALFSLCRIEHLLARRTNELSGGERQRIALAKQLLTKPTVLLLDEPFSNLDGNNRSMIKSLLEDIVNQLNITCIIVSHDSNEILSWADTIHVLEKGKLVQSGSPRELYHRSVNQYCAGLLGSFDLIDNHSRFPLFNHIPEVNGQHGKLFIRPDHILAKKNDDTENAFMVDKVIFNGSHSILLVKYFDVNIHVFSTQSYIKKGDYVSLNYLHPEPWFLS